MTKISENRTILKKNVKGIAFAIIAILILWQIVFHFGYWFYVGKGVFRSKVSGMVVHSLSCQNFVDDNPEANQKFSENWREQSKIYDFDYNDVKFTIEDECPVEDVEVDTPSESYQRHVEWMQTLDKNSYDKEKREWEKRIELEKKKRTYKIKFLNTEFSVFQ
jgi:hypothetical protein